MEDQKVSRKGGKLPRLSVSHGHLDGTTLQHLLDLHTDDCFNAYRYLGGDHMILWCGQNKTCSSKCSLNIKGAKIKNSVYFIMKVPSVYACSVSIRHSSWKHTSP